MKVSEKLQNRYEKAMYAQIELQSQLQASGFNLINCCNCGEVLIHKTATIEEVEQPIVCNSCLTEVKPNNCSDLYYDGMPFLDEEDFEENKIYNSDLENFLNTITEVKYLNKISNPFDTFADKPYYITIDHKRFDYADETTRNHDYELLKLLY